MNRCLLIFLLAWTGSPSHAVGADKRPLNVYILAGQSNMQGHAHISTFDAMRLMPETAPLLDQMHGAGAISHSR
jgi:alpha-galactosidase